MHLQKHEGAVKQRFRKDDVDWVFMEMARV
jgi:hypothetical protein